MINLEFQVLFHAFLICSWQPLAHSAWITRTTAFGKMGKSFVTSQEASITAGSPEFTGRIGWWRCTWRDWTPSSCMFTSFPSWFCLHFGVCSRRKRSVVVVPQKDWSLICNLRHVVWSWLYFEGISPGTTTKSLRACITSVGTGT